MGSLTFRKSLDEAFEKTNVCFVSVWKSIGNHLIAHWMDEHLPKDNSKKEGEIRNIRIGPIVSQLDKGLKFKSIRGNKMTTLYTKTS